MIHSSLACLREKKKRENIFHDEFVWFIYALLPLFQNISCFDFLDIVKATNVDILNI